ncbi:MAG: flavin reductase family protein [Proteobacteria bacterium]|nr:flavin reductase family protein [Pseudomonadota bacterium]
MYFDFETLARKDRYKLLVSTVLPRPIAFVTSLDEKGRINAAPFSFFNAMSAHPPVVVIGVNADETRSKDTIHNVRATGEFVVNMVCEAFAEEMVVCAADFPPGENELEAAGLESLPSVKVKPPRVAASPVNMECVLQTVVALGNDQNIVIGRVVAMHVKDEFLDAEKLYVATERLGVIGRMHGTGWYARTTDLVQYPRITYAQWLERHGRRKAGE